MGFTIGEGRSEEVDNTDLVTEAHKELDHLLTKLLAGELDGGEVHLEGHCESGHTHTFRLTLANWDDQQRCAFCRGTGAAKREFQIGEN